LRNQHERAQPTNPPRFSPYRTFAVRCLSLPFVAVRCPSNLIGVSRVRDEIFLFNAALDPQCSTFSGLTEGNF
jgi:hypothetical protein